MTRSHLYNPPKPAGLTPIKRVSDASRKWVIDISGVGINAILHEVTAAPGAGLYARRIQAQASKAEMMPIEHATGDFMAQAEKHK